MKHFKNLWILSFLTLALFSFSSNAQVGRNLSAYNHPAFATLGVYGYDPVSYFAEGGAQAQKADPSITLEHGGITYGFSSVENREIFKVMPERYEPTYGHFCAWAMSQGGRADIDPKLFTINGNRIHFFFSARAKRNFDRDVPRFEAQADQVWRSFSGEEPRL